MNRITDVPSDKCYVVSKYIDNPLLINHLKFDLRIYVLLTNIDPLVIYIYTEGLARFATSKYSLYDRNNLYKHLTNYSINKYSKNYIKNSDPTRSNVGNK